MKFLCVLLPHFPLSCEIQRHAAKARPSIILQAKDEAGSQKVVLDYSPELERLHPGMALQTALSTYGAVDLVQADIPHYWSVFNQLLDKLAEKSPLVEGSELGCTYIGTDGLQLLYRTAEALVSAIRAVIPAVFKVQTGIAEGKFLSYLIARYAGIRTDASSPDCARTPQHNHQPAIPFAADIATFLKDLPCDVLPISDKSKGKLHDYGIRTLGQLSNLPPGPLLAQFGPEGKRILELASGYDATPLYPRSVEEIIEESSTLSSVTVSLTSILAAIESLFARTFARDILKGRGIRSLMLWTRGWSGEHWERSLHFKEPAMDTRSIICRVRLILESYPQPGPVEQLGIRITGLGYSDGRQKSLFSEVRAKDHLMEDIRQLNLRLGDHQIFKVKEVEPWSRIPERRYALTPLN
jgi:DNA polymerase-4